MNMQPPSEQHLLRRCAGALAIAVGLLLIGWLLAAPADAAPRDAAPRHGVTVSIACSSTGMDQVACREGAEAWARQSGNRVNIVSTPSSATARLALYQQFLAARAPDIDVFTIDVVWPGLLGRYLIDLGAYVDAARRAEYEPALMRNDTVDGRLVALPWFADAGVLFYRQDLLDKYHLKPPDDWAALSADAAAIQRGERAAGNARFWGYVWQGRAYEGLTCNALEWIGSFGGGSIIAADGKVDVDNPRAIAALYMARGWVGTITPPGVLNYSEEEARGVFQAGNAAFMRNWPYAWALAQGQDSAIRGKVGVAALPAGPGGRHSAVLGGWQLAVSKFSAHPKQAAALVLYLTSRAEQKRRAIAYTFNPTMPSLFDDPEVLAAAPFLGRLRPVFADAVARPSAVVKTRYNEVSAAIWTRVHAVLTGEATAAGEMRALSLELRRIGHGGRW
jgi:trehalose/maltose transport system substrate-binding protein